MHRWHKSLIKDIVSHRFHRLTQIIVICENLRNLFEINLVFLNQLLNLCIVIPKPYYETETCILLILFP